MRLYHFINIEQNPNNFQFPFKFFHSIGYHGRNLTPTPNTLLCQNGTTDCQKKNKIRMPVTSTYF